MQNLPTFRQLQYLSALAEHGSFHKAADACAVTQSTLSGGIKDMEDILRGALIDRSSRRSLRLTPLGEEVLREGREMLTRMERLTAKSRAQTEPFAWPLRVGIIPTIAPYLLPRILTPLHKALPKLDLHIHELRSEPLVERVENGALDLAILAFPYDVKRLNHKIVSREKFVCAAPPGAFPKRRSVSMGDLAEQKLLLLEDGHCLRDHALAACKLQPLRETKTLSAASLSTLIQLVHQGYGVTLLPEMAVSNSAALPKGLRLLPFSSGAPVREIGFAWNERAPRARDISILLKEMTKLVKT